MIMLWCKKHPTYQAKRKPTAPCACCSLMWALRQSKGMEKAGMQIHSSSVSQSEWESMRYEHPEL